MTTLAAQLERAEQGRDGERQRADRAELATSELRGQVEQLLAQLAGQTEALERLQALEAAEAERQARGLLAQLRAAVRGP